jgi:hypothetical protein
MTSAVEGICSGSDPAGSGQEHCKSDTSNSGCPDRRGHEHAYLDVARGDQPPRRGCRNCLERSHCIASSCLKFASLAATTASLALAAAATRLPCQAGDDQLSRSRRTAGAQHLRRDPRKPTRQADGEQCDQHQDVRPQFFEDVGYALPRHVLRLTVTAAGRQRLRRLGSTRTTAPLRVLRSPKTRRSILPVPVAVAVPVALPIAVPIAKAVGVAVTVGFFGPIAQPPKVIASITLAVSVAISLVGVVAIAASAARAAIAEQPSRFATLERQLLLINGRAGVRNCVRSAGRGLACSASARLLLCSLLMRVEQPALRRLRLLLRISHMVLRRREFEVSRGMRRVNQSGH